MSDTRFARLKTDPRFRRPKRQQNKVVVDERFKSVFGDKSDKTRKGGKSARVDKYGRAVSRTHEQGNLRRFYHLNEDPFADEYADTAKHLDLARGEGLVESSDEGQETESEDDDGVVLLGQDRSLPIDIPREEDLEVELDEDSFADLDAQALAAQDADDLKGPQAEVQPTKRIAVVNLDWDHVRSSHLHKIFSSVISAGTTGKSNKDAASYSSAHLLSVRVYPSQFGKERMAHEEIEGPPSEVFRKHRELDEADVNEQTIYEIEEEGEVDDDALRKYQLERMRYFYAIAEFDSARTAARVFEELEGTELEQSANVFDLSYVPEDMSFDDDPRDEATGDSAPYQGLAFVTNALRHSKVQLTWDEDDPARNRVTRRNLTKKEIEEEDFRALVASSSGSEEEEEHNTGAKSSARERMRALLLDGDHDDQMPEGWGDAKGHSARSGKADADNMNMEITFTPGLSERNDPGNENTLEKYQRKMREKRKQRKEEYESRTKSKDTVQGGKGTEATDEFFGDASEEDEDVQPKSKSKKGKDKKRKEADLGRTVATAEELALLATSDKPDGEPKHFDMKSIVKSEKKKKHRKDKKTQEGPTEELQEDFSIDVGDERFKAVHEDHAFAIDPSNPQFKKTKSMTALLDERSKRRKRDDGAPLGISSNRMPTHTPAGGDQTIERLVDSVKRKTAANISGGPLGKRRRM